RDVNKPEIIVGLMTDKEVVIPVRNENADKLKLLSDIPIVFYKYDRNAEAKFSSKMRKDDRTKFFDQKELLERIYHTLKYNYSQQIQVDKANGRSIISPSSFINNYVNMDKIVE